jgi:hypothetical protein
MITLNKKIYFDLHLEVDLLCKSNGVAGVLFRVKNSFNYYAFVIDKSKGTKSIIKMVNGNQISLLTINDGGIVLNDWHRVIIDLRAGDIKITIYDMEQAQINTQKVLTYTDYTFISGTVGLFVNNMRGFYFVNLTVLPMPCWSPWVPKNEINVVNPNASLYNEDFMSEISGKFDILDPTKASKSSDWIFVNNMALNKYGIQQKSDIMDLSSAKKPAILILKRADFSNGTFCVKFKTEQAEGMVSVIFKYSKGMSKMGQESETFYTFDMLNSQKNGQFLLRKFINNEPRELSSVGKLNGLSELGYTTQGLNHVCIETINSQITVKVGQNSNLFNVINIEDTSFPSGQVGIGTFNTNVLFTYLDVLPPMLNLTANDVSEIMKKDTSEIFIPSVTAIKRTSYELPQQPMRESAMGTITSLSSLLGSVLGNNYNRPTGQQTSQTEVKNVFGNENIAATGFEQCIEADTSDKRSNICRRIGGLKIIRDNCEKQFCSTCCRNKISSGDGNALRNCEKQCDRQNAVESSPSDFRRVCIESDNPDTEIYNYCSSKIKPSNLFEMKTCKVDMCNLCCITMDVIKGKNYAFNTMQQCFSECANSKYNF